jgi:hypothetical protein
LEILVPHPLFDIQPTIMAGEVRQPIDLPSLERYLNQNVPVVKTPLDLKQVSI